MATTETTPDEAAPEPTVAPAPAPAPQWARLNVQIPSSLFTRLEAECDARMVGKALLVTKALESLLDELPPAP